MGNSASSDSTATVVDPPAQVIASQPLLSASNAVGKNNSDEADSLLIELDQSVTRLDQLGLIHYPPVYDAGGLMTKEPDQNRAKTQNRFWGYFSGNSNAITDGTAHNDSPPPENKAGRPDKLVIIRRKNQNESNERIFSTLPESKHFSTFRNLKFLDYEVADQDRKAKTEESKFSKETAESIFELRNKLLMEVGDDVLAGTLFCPQLPQEKNNNDQPQFQIKIKSHQHLLAKNDNNFLLSIPAHPYQVARLYCDDDYTVDSRLGVEGRGTVKDNTLRRSREILCSNMELPGFLASNDGIQQHFPFQVEAIRQRLAASSSDIHFEPYKLTIYKPGDFFKPHQDSVDSGDLFGTLVLHLPCIGDYENRCEFDDDQVEARSNAASGTSSLPRRRERRHVDLYSYDLSNSDDEDLDDVTENWLVYNNLEANSDLTKSNRRPPNNKKIHSKNKVEDDESATENIDVDDDETADDEAGEGSYRDSDSDDGGYAKEWAYNPNRTAEEFKKLHDVEVETERKNAHSSQFYCHLSQKEFDATFKVEKQPTQVVKAFLSSVVTKVKSEGVLSLFRWGESKDDGTMLDEDDSSLYEKKGMFQFYRQDSGDAADRIPSEDVVENQNDPNESNNNANHVGSTKKIKYFDPFQSSFVETERKKRENTNWIKYLYAKDQESFEQQLSPQYSSSSFCGDSSRINATRLRTQGGTLQFFVGRDTTDDMKKFRYSRPEFEPPSRASPQFCANILLQNYDRCELREGVVRDKNPSFANILAISSASHQKMENYQSSTNADDAEDSAQTESKKTNHHLPLHFAAFLTNVLHRVRPIRKGIRMTLQFKIYRKGSAISPLWGQNLLTNSNNNVRITVLQSVEESIQKLVSCLRNDSKLHNGNRNLAFGICLRHEYSPAALEPQFLKGIDFKIFQLLSEKMKFECLLSSASHSRAASGGRCFMVRDKLHREIILTPEHLELFSKVNAERLRCVCPSWNEGEGEGYFHILPTVKNIAWLDIGLGTLMAGGCCLGNWDSHYYWYTRQTVLICSPLTSCESA